MQYRQKYGRVSLLLAGLFLVVLSLIGINKHIDSVTFSQITSKTQSKPSNRQLGNFGHVIKDQHKVQGDDGFRLEELNTILTDLLRFHPNKEVSPTKIGFGNKVNAKTHLSFETLQEELEMPTKLLDELTKSNSLMLDYLNDKTFKVPEFESQAGAVIAGGVANDATWSALLTIRMFRKMGGTLPVEVMIPTWDDYYRDQDICEKFLKDLNAQCYILEERISLKRNTLQGAHYMHQFEKIKLELSILTSKFQNVLYLKPNVLILKTIKESLFNSKLFQQYGLVFWDDQGRRLTSPQFYEMNHIQVDQNTVSSCKGLELPHTRPATLEDEFHDLKNTLPYRQTSDSMVLVNKCTHFNAVILSLFYNLYGEGMYHDLLSVNSKLDDPLNSALIASAHVLSLPYYQINIDPEEIGFQYIDQFQTIGNIHFDPLADQTSMDRYLQVTTDPEKLSWDSYQAFVEELKLGKNAQFLELTKFELKPMEMFKNNLMFKNNGDRVRVFNSKFLKPKFEVEIWKVMNDYICNYEMRCAYLERHFVSAAERKQFCQTKMKNHITWLDW